MNASVASRAAVLFRPFAFKQLALKNRIVMAPMTRCKSPEGVPGADVTAYYRRRAEGGVGLIVTEGTYIPHPGAGFYPDVPHFYGERSLAGWKRVVDEVHAAEGRIFPQIWHVGLSAPADRTMGPGAVGPSGLLKPGERVTEPMTQQDIDDLIRAYGEAAASAERLGFDGVEIHGAHGYLIDQFFWEGTNQRTDRYGGDFVRRTRFAVEVIEEIRRNVESRISGMPTLFAMEVAGLFGEVGAHTSRTGALPQPLVEAGVDVFHCSQRRFWEPEFEGSFLNLAGWTKKLTGKPVITVGSVALNEEFTTSSRTGDTAVVTGIDELLDRMDRGEFDLVAVGRSLIVNPDWPAVVKRGAIDELQPYQRDVLQQLV